MLVAILAVLGIPPWVLLLAVLVIVSHSRNQFINTPGVFPLRLRVAGYLGTNSPIWEEPIGAQGSIDPDMLSAEFNACIIEKNWLPQY